MNVIVIWKYGFIYQKSKKKYKKEEKIENIKWFWFRPAWSRLIEISGHCPITQNIRPSGLNKPLMKLESTRILQHEFSRLARPL